MELITFLGKLFGYTPEIANVISGELRSVSEARRRPKVLHFLVFKKQKDPRTLRDSQISNLKYKIRRQPSNLKSTIYNLQLGVSR